MGPGKNYRVVLCKGGKCVPRQSCIEITPNMTRRTYDGVRHHPIGNSRSGDWHQLSSLVEEMPMVNHQAPQLWSHGRHGRCGADATRLNPSPPQMGIGKGSRGASQFPKVDKGRQPGSRHHMALRYEIHVSMHLHTYMSFNVKYCKGITSSKDSTCYTKI